MLIFNFEILQLLSNGEGDDCPVTTMSWISTFCGLVTVDSVGCLRTFILTDLENQNREIITATSQVGIIKQENTLSSHTKEHKNLGNSTYCDGVYRSNANIMTMQKYSPKQSLKFYGSRDPRLVTAWPENTILKIESIPHHFTAFSLRNLPHPSVTVHSLDYILTA